MPVSLSFNNEELLKKKYEQMNGVRVSGGRDEGGKGGSSGVNDDISFYDRYGANDVFSAASGIATNPTVRTGMDAGASSQGSSLTNDGNSNFSLVNALQTDNLPDSTVAIGGVNAAPGAGVTTPGGLHQPTGSDAENPQGGATDEHTNQHRGAYQNFLAQAGGGGGILESSPGPTGNRFTSSPDNGGGVGIGDKPPASEPKPTGEATFTTTNPDDTKPTDKSGGDNPSVNPQDSGESGVKNNPDVQNNPDNPKNDPSADNPPETSKDIDAEAEKRAAREAEKKAQAEAQRRAAEEAREKAA